MTFERYESIQNIFEILKKKKVWLKFDALILIDALYMEILNSL